jgi:nitrite reductase/ring-hydroxylating ferredoxin subunit
MERREFIKKAGLLGAIGLTGCAKTFRYTNSKPTRSEGKDGFLARVDELRESTSTLVYTKTGPVLLVKWQGEVKAFESVCPHTMCELNDGEGEQPVIGGEVRCWIHDSYFKPGDGHYISGPANPSGKLPEFPIRIEDGKIFRAVTT